MATTMRHGAGGTSITVRLRGPLFDGKVKGSVERAIIDESLEKIGQRMTRKGRFGSGGKGRGVRRNFVSKERRNLELVVESTLIWPRRKGIAWQRKNVAIVRAMARRVLKKTAERIVSELG